jgi:uncharacterized OsmC-like protein
MAITTTPTTLNGWDLQEVGPAFVDLAEHPEKGALTWHTHVDWDGGFAADFRTGTIEHADGTVARSFQVRVDHPPALYGEDTGPASVELVMAGLGACVAGTLATQATARGIRLDAVEVDLEAHNDMGAFLGLRDDVRPGLQRITVGVTVTTDADDAALADLADAVRQRSDIYDTLSNPVDVVLDVRRPD